MRTVERFPPVKRQYPRGQQLRNYELDVWEVGLISDRISCDER